MPDILTDGGVWIPSGSSRNGHDGKAAGSVLDRGTISSLDPMRSPSRFTTFRHYLDSVKTIPWVGACASLVAYTFAANPWRLLDDHDEEIDDDEHRLVRLLRRPNPWQSGFAFLELFNQQLNLTGNAYILLQEMDGFGRPRELYLPSPARMRPIPDAERHVKGYLFDVTGLGLPQSQLVFDPDEVIHCKLPNPTDEFVGLGNVEMMARLLETVDAMATNELGYWSSGGRIVGVLQTSDTLSDEEFERIKREWRLAQQDVKQRARIAILEKGLRYQPIAEGLRSLDLVTIAKEKRDEILAIWGVPATKLGILENAQYKQDEADRFFITETMAPQWTRFEDDIQPLVDRFEPGGRLAFERRTYEDDAARIGQAVQMLTSGLISLDEARVYAGWEPLRRQAGQVFYVPSGLASVPVAGMGTYAAETVAPTPPSDSGAVSSSGDTTDTADAEAVLGGKSPDARRVADRKAAILGSRGLARMGAGRPRRSRHVKAEDRGRRPRKWSREAAVRHREETVARLTKTGAEAVAAAARVQAAVVATPEWVQSAREWPGSPELGRAIDAIHRAAAQTAYSWITSPGSLATKAAPPKATPPKTVFDIYPDLLDELGTHHPDIDSTTRDEVADVIEQGVRRGLGPAQIASGEGDFGGLRGVFRALETWRAEDIARTEAGASYVAGAIRGARTVGAKELELIDGTGDEICALRNGSRVPVDSDPGLAHPSCTVTVIPVVEAEDEFDFGAPPGRS